MKATSKQKSVVKWKSSRWILRTQEGLDQAAAQLEIRLGGEPHREDRDGGAMFLMWISIGWDMKTYQSV